MTRAPGRTAAAVLSAAGLATASLPADGDAQERGRSAADRCDSAEIAAVADRVAGAFETHPFVFLSSTHGGVKRHDFLLCLLSRPASLDAVAPDPRDLPEKIFALVYLGPEPDRNFEGTLEISESEREELARRRSLKTRETLEIRFGGRDRWFEAHPLDVSPDPRRPER